MPNSIQWLLGLTLFISSTADLRAEDWLQWRGPFGDNHAPSDEIAPLTWSDD
ncbi:hypothetical protein [Adhaeretor mobilis]|uniref:hypothetical protein n=1 Tax=Adhaeretor mobilis TaxID=1930276 RepID=UPI001C54D93B|nr:hypothetical protein [Adhaeretor mobilis]